MKERQFLDTIQEYNGTLTKGSGANPPLIYIQVTVVCLYSLVIVISVGGNFVISAIVLANKIMRTVTNMFIVALSVSDVLMAVLCIPFTFVSNIVLMYWPFGQIMCPFVLFMQTFAVLLSALTLVAISFDKYIAVLYPFRTKLSKRNTLVIIALIYLCAAGVSLPTALVSKVKYRHGYTLEMCIETWGNGQHRNTYYSVSIMLLQYFIPLGVLSFTYGRIGYVIWIKKPPGEAETARDQRMARSKRKMVKMMIVVVLCYAGCWLPLHVITIIGDIDISIYNYHYMVIVWTAAHWLAMANCCCNPIIYLSMNSKFKAAFFHMLRFIPCARRYSRRYDTYFSKPSHTTQVTQIPLAYRTGHNRRTNSIDYLNNELDNQYE